MRLFLLNADTERIHHGPEKMKPLYRVVETQHDHTDGEQLEPADEAILVDIDGCSYTYCIDNLFW